MEQWNKVRALPLTEYVIVEPEKGEKIETLRASLYTRLSKLAKATNANFKLRLALSRRFNHVAIWKEPKKL